VSLPSHPGLGNAFLLTIAPLRLQHTTGSPVNPIALF